MKRWSVTAQGLASVQVQGRNWIVALGRGLEELGRAADVARLACEVLQNGTVIAREIGSGTGFVVQEVDKEALVGPLPPLGVDATEDEILGEAPDSTLDDDETEVEQIFELPADAIAVLTAEDSLDAIFDADTVLMACQVALAASLERVSAESGAVILDERGYLRFCAVSGPNSRKLMGVRLPKGTGVAGYAMEQRRTIVLGDAQDDPRHCGEVDALTGYHTRQIAVVPLCDGDTVLGVIELINLEGPQRFVEADVVAVQEVADVLAERLSR